MKNDIISWKKFDLHLLDKYGVLKNDRRKRGSGRDYLNIISAFDIETTNDLSINQAYMYIWQWQIEEYTIIGRSWKEFKHFYHKIQKYCGNRLMVVYVHNLSFEFQFLKSVIPVEDVMALDDRKIIRFFSGNVEWRCSYMNTNQSLDRFLKNMKVENMKTTLDYSKKRYPWTILSDDEIRYCINDVKGLVQALKKEMDKDGDNLYTIPLTSTGYIRREAKRIMRPLNKVIKDYLPEGEVFMALRKAFRGGDTHANRYNAGKIIKAHKDLVINSYDISSSYPSVLMTKNFPGKFTKTDPKKLSEELNKGRACLFHIAFHNIYLKNILWGDPYIPLAKTLNCLNYENDNGRILKAEYLELYVTEIDFAIICDEYEFDYEVMELWTARKSKLPETFRSYILYLYRQKTLLKGDVDDYNYQRQKMKFNSCYGMMVQNPVKPDMIFKNGLLVEDSKPFEDRLKDYYKTGWLPYQWGVWCTAWARFKLYEGIKAIPPEAHLYNDTDSVKFIGNYSDRFDQINKHYLVEDLAAEDKNGKLHYMGIFENEVETPIIAFSTLGAKKYAYEDANGLHVTISGVSKQKGAEELQTIDNFVPGFVFRKAGGNEVIYNDFPEIKRLSIDKHHLKIVSNALIKDSFYTLSLTYEYERLLNYLNQITVEKDLYFTDEFDIFKKG